MYLLCIYVCPSQSVTDNPLVATKLYLYLFPWPVLASYYFVFSHFESSIQAAYASYSKPYITAATPQLDWERLSPKEIHDLSSLQGEALVYIGNPQASPITETVGWVASVQNLLMFQHKTSVQKSHLAHIQ